MAAAGLVFPAGAGNRQQRQQADIDWKRKQVEQIKMDTKAELVELTAEIVAAYVGNNPVSSTDLSNVINDVHKALTSAVSDAERPEKPELKPAIAIRRSVTPDYIICLEDGKRFKSLKRHLRTHYNLSPDEYREKWGLPRDYPMVAPNYAEARSKLAKKMGLGQKGRKSAA